MRTLHTAKYLVTGVAPPLEGGAVLTVGKRIAGLGPLAHLRARAPGVEVVDFGDALVVPLLVNAHTHLELTDYPGWAAAGGGVDAPGGFVDWLLGLIRVKRGIAPEAFARSVEGGVRRSLAAGTAAVGDVLSHYPAGDAYGDGPLEGVAFLETLGQEPARVIVAERLLEEALTGAWDGHMSPGVSPHSPYTIGAGYMERVYRMARQRGLRCTTHLAESREEVEFLATGRGDLARRFYPAVGWGTYLPGAAHRTPAAALEQRGGFFPENLLVHGVQLTGSEIELLAGHRMRLVLCPRSNARLEVGRAPVEELLKAGIPLALGTDSLASNDTLSVWDEMSFAHTWFGGALDPPTLFRMATLGGAEALGLDHELGALEVGKQASFAVVRPRNLPRRGELFDFLVAPGRTEEIEQVFMAGDRVWPPPKGETKEL